MDELAAEMEAVLNDDSYRSVFERPRIKMASVKEPEVKDNTIKHAYKQLVEASRILDDLGLFKSSERALSAVETLLSEAEAKDDDKEDDKEDEEDDKNEADDDKKDEKKDEKKDPPWLKKKEESQDKKPGEGKPAPNDKPEKKK